MAANVDAMASKGLRSTNLSTDTKIDAGDVLRKPLKPLLAIACVVRSCIYFFSNYIYSSINLWKILIFIAANQANFSMNT